MVEAEEQAAANAAGSNEAVLEEEAEESEEDEESDEEESDDVGDGERFVRSVENRFPATAIFTPVAHARPCRSKIVPFQSAPRTPGRTSPAPPSTRSPS